MNVEVVPYNPKWRDAFETEAAQVAAALDENVVAIHHIGSTAIPNIYAKPVIDMLIDVRGLVELDTRNLAMRSLGYETMGEFGIAGRRYFRKDDAAGIRTHQIYAFQTGSAQIERHLAFRDYMIAHPENATIYSDLKRKLAHENPLKMDRYIDGKDSFIQEIDRKTAEWKALRSSG